MKFTQNINVRVRQVLSRTQTHSFTRCLWWLSRYEAQTVVATETTWPPKLKVSSARPFTGKVCRPRSETRRFLNWGASGPTAAPGRAHGGGSARTPAARYCAVTRGFGREAAESAEPASRVISEGPAECWQPDTSKDQKTRSSSSPGLAGDGGPVRERGMCPSNVSINRTAGSKHARHIKRELSAYDDKNEILS